MGEMKAGGRTGFDGAPTACRLLVGWLFVHAQHAVVSVGGQQGLTRGRGRQYRTASESPQQFGRWTLRGSEGLSERAQDDTASTRMLQWGEKGRPHVQQMLVLLP